MALSTTPRFDALVLAGGRGTRLGGAAKADVVVAGATLLERARSAVAMASATIVVGPEVAGGPVAAVAAGLREVTADVVVVLAVDMPLVSARTVGRLVAALEQDAGGDGVLLTDDDGRQQYLAGAYRAEALRAAVLTLDSTTGASMRRLVQGLRLGAAPAHPDEAMDCDTWPGVRRAAELLEGR